MVVIHSYSGSTALLAEGYHAHFETQPDLAGVVWYTVAVALLIAVPIAVMAIWTAIQLALQADGSQRKSRDLADHYVTPAVREAERVEAELRARLAAKSGPGSGV